MFTPEREPHPAVAEIRYLMQPVMFTPNGAFASAECVRVEVTKDNRVSGLRLSITNRYVFSTLEHLEWSWTMTSNRSPEPIRKETFELNDAEGKSDVCIDLESVISRILVLEKSRPSRGNSYFLNLQGILKEDSTWAKAGHVLIAQQIPVKFVFAKPASRKKNEAKPLERVSWKLEGGKAIIERPEKGGPKKLVVLDPQSGGIDSIFGPSGENLLAGTILPNFSRAATDNDRGGLEQPIEFLFPGTHIQYLFGILHNLDEFSYWSRWNHVGLDASAPPVIECADLKMSQNSDQTQVLARASCHAVSPLYGTTLFDIEIKYTVWGSGHINVHYHVVPTPVVRRISSLPRVGIKMAVVSWFVQRYRKFHSSQRSCPIDPLLT